MASIVNEDPKNLFDTGGKVMTINRATIKCPISDCNCNIGVDSFYFRDHTNYFNENCKYNVGKELNLVFRPPLLAFNKNVCLAAPETPPSPSKPLANWKDYAHLPILIMACRTSRVKLLVSEEDDEKYESSNDFIEEPE